MDINHWHKLGNPGLHGHTIAIRCTDSFTFSAGFKKDDGLSVNLFVIGLHYDIKDVDQRERILNKTSFELLSKQCYSEDHDDVMIVNQ